MTALISPFGFGIWSLCALLHVDGPRRDLRRSYRVGVNDEQPGSYADGCRWASSCASHIARLAVGDSLTVLGD
jgi:hypothetical protein